MLILACNIKFPRRPDAEVFNNATEKCIKAERKNNFQLLEDYYDNYNDSYPNTFHDTYTQGKRIISETSKILGKLEEYKQVLKDSMVILHNSKKIFQTSLEKKIVRNFFIKNHKADSIQYQLIQYADFLSNQVGFKFKNAIIYHMPICKVVKNLSCHLNADTLIAGMIVNSHIKETITLISAVQNLIVLSEQMILWEVLIEGMPFICFNGYAFQCIAVPKQSFVFPGQKVNAQMFLASYEGHNNPIVVPKRGKIDKCEHGIAYWSNKSPKLGIEMVSGVATLLRKTDTIIRPWSFHYLVVAKGITMQLDKMNTCYRGIDNPITISVPGYLPKKLRLSIEGAEIRQISDSQYNINASNTRANILYAYVYAKDAGKKYCVAGLKMAIKDLPLPVASIGREITEGISHEYLKKQDGVYAIYQDEDLTPNCTINGYNIYVRKQNGTFIGPLSATGNKFNSNAEIVNVIEQITAGDKIIITDIVAKQANKELELNPMSFTIQ